MPANVLEMVSVREAPWHGLGVIVPDYLSIEEAFKLGGLDYEVEKSLLYRRVDCGTLPPRFLPLSGEEVPYKYKAKGATETEDRTFQQPAQYQVVRTDNQATLAPSVKAQFTPLQNTEMMEYASFLLGEGARVVTAGVLGKGERAWILLGLGERNILSDAYENFLFLCNGNDGKTTFQISISPVRVVCQNTWNVALQNAAIRWSCRHRPGIAFKKEEAMEALSQNELYMAELEKVMGKLATTHFDASFFERFINAMYPVEKRNNANGSVSQYQTRAEDRQSAFRAIYNHDDNQNFRGTLQGLVNALTDASAHLIPDRETTTWRENRFANIMDGRESTLNKGIEILRAEFPEARVILAPVKKGIIPSIAENPYAVTA